MSRPVLSSALLLFGLAGMCPAFATTTSTTQAQTSAASPPPAGYHDRKLPGGMVIRVPDDVRKPVPSAAADDDGKYDPENADFSRTSSYANKSFGTGQATLSKHDSAEEAREGKRFATGSYATQGYNQAGRAFQTAAYRDATPSDPGLDKSFSLPRAFATGPAFDSSRKSEYQDKPSLLAQNTPKIDPFSAPGLLTEKTFVNPIMMHVPHQKRDLYASKENLDVARMVKLPDRALTVDEVRDLINHDQTPDLGSAPDTASKPLNDPAWRPPENAPPALDDRPLKPGPVSEDKSGDLPSPGMMAQPAGGSQPPSK